MWPFPSTGRMYLLYNNDAGRQSSWMLWSNTLRLRPKYMPRVSSLKVQLHIPVIRVAYVRLNVWHSLSSLLYKKQLSGLYRDNVLSETGRKKKRDDEVTLIP